LQELAAKYQLAQSIYHIKILSSSNIINKALKELSIPRKYGISIVEVRRKVSNKLFQKIIQETAGPETVLLEGDTLFVMGDWGNIDEFIRNENLELIEDPDNKSFLSKEIGIAEVVLMPDSKLASIKVRDIGFREKYNVNILSVHQRNQFIINNLPEIKLHGGDSLLLQGAWADITRLTEEDSESGWVVVGQPLAEASKIPNKEKAPIAAIIMLLMVICMAFNLISGVAAVMLAAVLMVLTGCLRNMEDAYKTINWESIVLIAAMMPMSIALENTGAAKLISDGLVGGLGKYGSLALLAGVYMATSLLTMFISNTATAVLVAPIAMQAAQSFNASPVPFMFAVSVAASMCFASPFSTPPNALVMSAGRYTFMDYIRVGLPLQIIMAIIMILVLPLIFPF
jgi:di/tricarboxylate transporter